MSSATATHCPYCALQCGMNLASAGRALKVKARDFPVNRGGLCQKGWSAAELLDHPERLTTPLIRDAKGRALRPASWDEALERIAFEIRSAQASFGPDAVGVFGGAVAGSVITPASTVPIITAETMTVTAVTSASATVRSR